MYPKGPKIEKIQDRPPGLKVSIEIENFNLDPQQTPIFCGEFWGSGIEIFNRDRIFQSRLNFFNLWALRVMLLSFSSAVNLWGRYPDPPTPAPRVFLGGKKKGKPRKLGKFR